LSLRAAKGGEAISGFTEAIRTFMSLAMGLLRRRLGRASAWPYRRLAMTEAGKYEAELYRRLADLLSGKGLACKVYGADNHAE